MAAVPSVREEPVESAARHKERTLVAQLELTIHN
jgi:hypothetical protein